MKMERMRYMFAELGEPTVDGTGVVKGAPLNRQERRARDAYARRNRTPPARAGMECPDCGAARQADDSGCGKCGTRAKAVLTRPNEI